MIKLTKEQLLDGARSLASGYVASNPYPPTISGVVRLSPPDEASGWSYEIIGVTQEGRDYVACSGTLSDSEVVIRALILAALM